ncbi:hypothetical protein [Burkholderia lata]|uniref:hypothetical protein n=1 Tax=Burkholderia lata (strain ATCC 17760 / DSM 23089 / LMG 22485 / NCIMB 9086 / R18194 / 383) TaxID=482957 RepID=UPI0015838FE6|nr:hypothetical protein [Burkholderia lata]
MNEMMQSTQPNISDAEIFADVQTLNATDWTLGIQGGAMKERMSWVWTILPGEGGSIW